ncbi:MAG: hypothetical protein ACREPR_27350 [Brasilonema sp.]
MPHFYKFSQQGYLNDKQHTGDAEAAAADAIAQSKRISKLQNRHDTAE